MHRADNHGDCELAVLPRMKEAILDTTKTVIGHDGGAGFGLQVGLADVFAGVELPEAAEAAHGA